MNSGGAATGTIEFEPPGPTLVTTSAPSDRPPRPARNHALDGLRGLAVVVVVVYHFSPDLLPGGYLGVSVFFTLSGFLITNIIVSEWSDTHTVDTRRFWSRRARRLLPAAVAAVVLTCAITLIAGDGKQIRGLAADAAAALAYGANWRFIAVQDPYGATYQSQSTLLHYWSLAIEEQFYLVIGLAAWWIGRHSARRRAWWTLAGAIALFSIASTVYWGLNGNHDRVYFGTDTRAFELAAGMLLALAIGGAGRGIMPRLNGGRWLRRSAAALGALALVAFGWACLVIDDRSPILDRGGFVACAAISTLVILACLGDNPVNRALSFRPLAWMGLISYGVYLYHWPLMTLLSKDRTGLDGAALFAVRAAATLAVALLSYHLLEQPILQGRWKFRPVALGGVLAGIAAAVTIGLVSVTVLGPGLAAKRDIAGAAPELANDVGSEPAAVAPPVQVPPPQRVLFLGDSLVHQAFPTITDELAQYGMTAQAIGGPSQTFNTHDGSWLVELRSALDTFKPDVVVLEGCCGTDLRDAAGTSIADPWPDTADAALWMTRANEATQMALDSHAAVMWVLVPPAGTNGWYGYIEDRINWLRDQYAQIAACRAGVATVDWRSISNPDGSYAASLPAADGSMVQIRTDDGLHFTPVGQRLIAQLSRQGILAYWQDRASGNDAGPTEDCTSPPPVQSNTAVTDSSSPGGMVTDGGSSGAVTASP